MSDHFTRVLSRPEFIALMAALMALNAMAIDIMLPALPYMGEALGVTSENERQFVITAYMLGMGAAQLAFGPLTDRFGRRAPGLTDPPARHLCEAASARPQANFRAPLDIGHCCLIYYLGQ